jgi:hypothetical protein
VGGVFYFYPENITFETEPKEHPGAHMALFFDDTAVKPALYEFKKFRDSLSGCCS